MSWSYTETTIPLTSVAVQYYLLSYLAFEKNWDIFSSQSSD